jgi:two-component system KDP operon response regulator KdpE
MSQAMTNSSSNATDSEDETQHQGTVLIVEDDTSLRRTLNTTLTALGFDIGQAATGEEALTRLRMVEYDVVLLDINMPGMGGIEACRQIRKLYPRLPILMLTVRDSEDDKVIGLESGADDYITKPFQMRELTARIRSAIRRLRTPELSTQEPLVIGDICLDPIRRLVEKAGNSIHLTPKEFQILQLMMEKAGMAISHSTLLTTAWGPEHGESREYLRVVMNSLRKKLEGDPANPEYILTESHIGYRFRDK